MCISDDLNFITVQIAQATIPLTPTLVPVYLQAVSPSSLFPQCY